MVPDVLSHSYQYHAAHGRLASATDQTAPQTPNVTYSYLANSNLLAQQEFQHGGQTSMTSTRSYDAANRLTSISSTTPTSTLSAFSYQFDAASRRSQATLADGSTWHYSYNDRGELTEASRQLADSSPFPGQQFAFTFDDIGNRTTTVTNGRTATYTPNANNQYDARTVPSFRDLRGSAHPQATVSVDQQKAQRTPSGEFHHAVEIDNSSAAQHPETEILGVRNHAGPADEDLTDTQSGRLFLPRSPENFA